MFAKNERGSRLTAKNKRFWSLLILLLSVASVRKKLLKTTHTEERNVHTNCRKLQHTTWIVKKIHLISNKSFRYYKLQSSIIFRRISIKVNISKYFLFVMHLKRRNSWPPGVSGLDALNDFTWWQSRLAEKTSF